MFHLQRKRSPKYARVDTKPCVSCGTCVLVCPREAISVYRGCYLTSLSQVNGEDYKLTGWYDDLGCSAGGRVRIIVASAK